MFAGWLDPHPPRFTKETTLANPQNRYEGQNNPVLGQFTAGLVTRTTIIRNGTPTDVEHPSVRLQCHAASTPFQHFYPAESLTYRIYDANTLGPAGIVD